MSSQGSLSGCLSEPCPAGPQLRLYQTVIFATPIFLTLILLLLFCMLYLRRRRIANHNSQIRAQFFTSGFVSPPQEEGLTKSFRQQLPTVPFDEKFTNCREDTQCSVCLGEYQWNEKLQQLPLCGHTFHVECIDEWLMKSTTCPICRTSLLQKGVRSPLSHEFSASNPSSRWEDLVLNDGSFGRQAEAPSLPPHGGEGSDQLSLDVDATTLRISIEHAINIERS